MEEVGATSDEAGCVVVGRTVTYGVLPFVLYFAVYWFLSEQPGDGKENKAASNTVSLVDRYKVQKGLTGDRLKFKWPHLLHVVALQLFISLPLGFALSPLWPNHGYSFCPPSSLAWLAKIIGAAATSPPLDLHPPLTLFRFAFELLVIMICFEVGFFYSHFILHKQPFYRLIHKMHHYYTAAQYVHWAEHLVANNLAPIVPAIMVGAHPVTFMFWILLATCTVVCSHSGYGSYTGISGEGHDQHHKYFNVNYGTLSFLDYLHGTLYEQSAQFLRDQHKKIDR